MEVRLLNVYWRGPVFLLLVRLWRVLVLLVLLLMLSWRARRGLVNVLASTDGLDEEIEE